LIESYERLSRKTLRVLQGLGDADTGVARESTLRGLVEVAVTPGAPQISLDGLATTEALNLLADEVGNRDFNPPIHQRLTILEDPGTGIARAGVVATATELTNLQEVVGTRADSEEALTVYGRLNRLERRVGTLEGIICGQAAHWEAERILTQNQTPEPYRSALFALMASSECSLAGGGRYRVQTYESGNTQVYMSHIFSVAWKEQEQWGYKSVVKIVTKIGEGTWVREITTLDGEENPMLQVHHAYRGITTTLIDVVKYPGEPEIEICGGGMVVIGPSNTHLTSSC
jgi:hypothetical protein